MRKQCKKKNYSSKYMKSDLQMLMDGLFVQKQSDTIEGYILKSKFKRKLINGFTVYKQDRKSNKVVVFVSGGSVLTFTHYVQKLVDDLSLRHCDILVFEKLGHFNLTCIQGIADILQTYSHITIVGCSLGGVIGSHVLSKLDGKTKRLICIDTPFHIYSSIPLICENKQCIWRPDIYELYKCTIDIVQESYSLTDLFQITNMKQYETYVSKHFGITNYECMSSMNPEIQNTEIISFYNEFDPVVVRSYSIPTVEKYKKKLDKSSTCKEVCIKYDYPGHCTEWATDRKIIRQLRKLFRF